MTESRTATNALLGSYVYNERGLRVKAERSAQSSVQVVAPNGGESLYMGALDTISWNGMGLAGALVKLELLVGGAVAGTIAENLPGAQTSFQWQVGKTLTGAVNPGSDYKVRVTAVVPPAASGTTYYFYDSGGRLLSEYNQAGFCMKDYLYLGGKMIGEFQPSESKYYYYASDQINSTRLVTDSTGTVVHSAQYDPYGGLYKTWVDTYHPKPGFSGKEREFGSEMDYFGARYYVHKQYRFLSVDPEMNKDESLINPQSWNFYSYCRNNPITFVDPDGRTELKFFIKLGILEINPQQKGRSVYRISASSGKADAMNNPDMINEKNKGPIPIGEYEINTNELSDPGLIKDIIRNFTPFLGGDWGDWRVPINPKEGTKTFGRSGFFLHCGKSKGSKGCIDIEGGLFGNKNTDLVKSDILNDTDKKVPLSVVR